MYQANPMLKVRSQNESHVVERNKKKGRNGVTPEITPNSQTERGFFCSVLHQGCCPTQTRLVGGAGSDEWKSKHKMLLAQTRECGSTSFSKYFPTPTTPTLRTAPREEVQGAQVPRRGAAWWKFRSPTWFKTRLARSPFRYDLDCVKLTKRISCLALPSAPQPWWLLIFLVFFSGVDWGGGRLQIMTVCRRHVPTNSSRHR